MEETIRNAVTAALATIGGESVAFAVETPADPAHGDYAINAALAASKMLSKPPRAIAEELVPLLVGALGTDAARVTIAGPGFINITLSQEALSRSLASACDASWGRNASREGKRIMIEYGNPNPFKEMHIGHMTGAIIGESISRLLEYTGAHVLRDTFGGDVGPHVAKALWALRQDGVTDVASPKEIGAAYIHGSNAYEESEQSKAEIDALNTVIYRIVEAKDDGLAALTDDERALLTLWRKGREVSMEEFERLFKLLGTHFDYVFFDSDTTEPGLAEVRRGVERGIFEESEGAIIYRGEKVGLNTLVFITSRGTPTYETKDVGLAFLKELRTETDEVIITTAIEQIAHFKVFLAALAEVAPLLAQKTHHIAHGLLQLTTGKMSSRKGNIITAAELIANMIESTQERNDDPLVAQQVAIAAIKYMILRSSPGSNIIFDPEKSLSLEGDSGPYLQYALVRAKTILEKSVLSETADVSIPSEPYLLTRLIHRFPEVVAKAQSLQAPHTIAQYLTLLAGEWNSFYAQERIIGGDYEAYKLDVVRAFISTMEKGLWLLGIPAPERM